MLTFILIILVSISIILKYTVSKNDYNYEYWRDIPTNDSPAYVGKITKGHIDGNDIVATILDLNYRGYIKIEIENIKGRDKKVLYLEKAVGTLNLKEHELFIINQIFKNNTRIVFDDYVKSKKFKKDFKIFDKMLDRRIERKTIYKNSMLKNLSKIIFLVSFLTFGIVVFYSMLIPLILLGVNMFTKNENTIILVNIIISGTLFILVAYRYISYINKSTSTQEDINLHITYIVLSVLLGCCIIFGKFDSIIKILHSEMIWYKILTNFIFSVITLLYMFNIIRHNEQKEYLYYCFIIVSIFSIILRFDFMKCISIVFFTTYIFLKTPKHNKLKENDYIYKWNCFKKYLEDYSMLSEQKESAIIIWEQYLIYAVSLGVNKKIIKEYSKLENTVLIDEQYLKRCYIEYIE